MKAYLIIVVGLLALCACQWNEDSAEDLRLDENHAKYTWVFGMKEYDTFYEFREAFNKYNKGIANKTVVNDFVLIQARRVMVEYLGAREGSVDYDDRKAMIESETSLTFLTFMYQLNNKVFKHLEHADARFYEGLELKHKAKDVPVLILLQGS